MPPSDLHCRCQGLGCEGVGRDVWAAGHVHGHRLRHQQARRVREGHGDAGTVSEVLDAEACAHAVETGLDTLMELFVCGVLDAEDAQAACACSTQQRRPPVV